ncbi:MAG: hypothetical protein K8T20_11290 [Planctomycetes bacterium]|nr:hypothetical protein [Planctomycetota bacterium]
MRWLIPALLAGLVLAGCASSSNVAEGDQRFEARDFDGAASAYGKAAADRPGDAELGRKLEAARKNAATAHAERAAEAADKGDLDRALEEIRTARRQDGASERVAADEKKYAALRESVASQVAASKSADPEEAHRILSGIERYKATFPEITVRLAQARDGYVRKLISAAEDLGKAGEWMKSQYVLEHAQLVSAAQPQLSEMVKATRTNLRVLELLDQGWRLKAQDDLDGALQRFQTAVELRPDAAEAKNGLAAAKRGLGEKWATSAREAHDGGDAIAAYALLAKAEGMDKEAPGIEEISATVRRDAAKELIAKASEAGKRGLPGLEWLRLQQAKAVLPAADGIDQKVRDAGTKLDRASRPVVLVKAFRNATNQGGREVRLASESYRLLQQLSGNGKFAMVMDEDGWEVFLKENPGLTPDIVVKATLNRFDLLHHPDLHSPEFKEYQKRVTYLDVTGQKYVDGVETRTYHYDIVDKSVDGVAELSYEIYDVATRTPLSSDDVRGDLHREDRVVAGSKEAAVDEDPDEMPPDNALNNDLATQLRDRLLERLRSELGWFGKKYYTAYEKARDAGQTDLAVSNAVLATRSRQSAGLSVLAEDLEWLRRRTGWDMGTGKIDAENLR